MLFGQDRDQLRRTYVEAWRKHNQGEPMEPLEQQIAQVIAQHPEYHSLLEQEERALGGEFLPETGESNPFLHMGLHLAIQEQLSTDRPAGLVLAYKTLLMQIQDPHETEHQVMECLAESLWQSQRNNTPPDEAAYVRCIQARAHKG